MSGFNDILSEALARYNRKTRADAIRNMTDDALAGLIVRSFYDENFGCPINRFEDGKIRCHVYDNECEACWLDWLSQPPEEGEL